jgi:hypothetical protein
VVAHATRRHAPGVVVNEAHRYLVGVHALRTSIPFRIFVTANNLVCLPRC